MLVADKNLMYVSTNRGEIGPVAMESLPALVEEGQISPIDQVRNAFGRPLGSVGALLPISRAEPPSRRIRQAPAVRSAQPPRNPPSPPRRLPWALIAGSAAAILILAVGWLALSSPAGRAPVAERAALPAIATMLPAPATASAPDPVLPSEQAVATPRPKPPAASAVQAAAPPPAQPASITVVPGPALVSLGGFHLTDLGTMAIPTPPPILGADGIWRGAATGMGIWGADDQCRLLHRPFAGDGTVQVRLLSSAAQHPKAEFGVMLRVAPEVTSSAFYFLHWSPSGTLRTLIRNGKWVIPHATSEAQLPLPVWLRVSRQGGFLSAGASGDGKTWIVVDPPTAIPAFQGPLAAGVAMATHERDPRPVTFSDLSVTP